MEVAALIIGVVGTIGTCVGLYFSPELRRWLGSRSKRLTAKRLDYLESARLEPREWIEVVHSHPEIDLELVEDRTERAKVREIVKQLYGRTVWLAHKPTSKHVLCSYGSTRAVSAKLLCLDFLLFL